MQEKSREVLFKVLDFIFFPLGFVFGWGLTGEIWVGILFSVFIGGYNLLYARAFVKYGDFTWDESWVGESKEDQVAAQRHNNREP